LIQHLLQAAGFMLPEILSSGTEHKGNVANNLYVNGLLVKRNQNASAIIQKNA